MKSFLRYIFGFFLLFLPFFVHAQPKNILDELKRAGKYEESKKFDTYHVYEKYLTTEQRYELNMYYWRLKVDIPNENAKNYWLLKSALANNVCAQINLAYSYKIGRTVNKDSNKCRYWFLKAISNNSSHALFYYGLSCINGVFAKSTNDSAIYFLQKASEEKVFEAYLAMSYCYKYGLNTVKNDELAEKQFLKYKTYFNKTYNPIKVDFEDLDSSIYFPTGFSMRKMIESQISVFMNQLKSDSLLEISITSNGNSSYLEFQQSWDKASLIRTLFIENGIDPKRVSFYYGGNGNQSIVKAIIRRTEEFANNYPPPPYPNYIRKYLILGCE